MEVSGRVGLSINRILVSRELFARAVAAVGRCSTAQGRFVSISEAIEAGALAALAHPPLRSDLLAWLNIDLQGAVPVTLVIRERWRPTYDEARDRLGAIAGRNLSAREMVAVLTQVPVKSPGSPDVYGEA